MIYKIIFNNILSNYHSVLQLGFYIICCSKEQHKPTVKSVKISVEMVILHSTDKIH